MLFSRVNKECLGSRALSQNRSFNRPLNICFKEGDLGELPSVLLQHIAFKSQDKTGHNQHVYLPGTFKEVRDFTVPHEFLGQPFT